MRGCLRFFILLIVLAGLAWVGLWAFRAGAAPEVTIEPAMPGIGRKTPVTVKLDAAGRGIDGVRVELVQGELVRVLEERDYEPRPAWELWGQGPGDDEITVAVGRDTIEELSEGEATIRVVAERAPAFLRRPDPVVAEKTLPVRLRPPVLSVLSTRTYVDQGGVEAVVYRTGDSAIRHGVQAGGWWFPGYEMPGGNTRFALFSVPYDLDDPTQVRLVAADDVGNEARVAFIDRFTRRPFDTDTIQITDAFMQRVVPDILAHTDEVKERGTLLETYLAINGELRQANNRVLLDLATTSRPEFLWREPFLPMRNAAVMSSFADRRSYVYEGQVVDHQDHLGFDLASVTHAEIQAANSGVVVLARYLGIYGNTVVIDHGYGLMSLYGHLSSIDVEEGAEVARGQVVGRSGQTGLAGGDHLHFTMMLHGLPVNPREWWDGHWIHDRLKLKLGGALPFGG